MVKTFFMKKPSVVILCPKEFKFTDHEATVERPFLGKRHTCLIDRARNLVSFDGGKAVPLPVAIPPYIVIASGLPSA